MGFTYEELIAKGAKPVEAPRELGLIEKLESYTGAPTRQAISSLVDTKNPIEAAKSFKSAWGEDPNKAIGQRGLREKLGLPDVSFKDALELPERGAKELMASGLGLISPEMGKAARSAPTGISPISLAAKTWPKSVQDASATDTAVGMAADWSNALQTGLISKAGSKIKQLAPALEAASKPLTAAAKSLESWADMRAIKSLGAKKGQFAKLIKEGKVGPVGERLFSEGLVDAISTPKRMYERLDTRLSEIGSKLKEPLQRVFDAAGDYKVDMQNFASEIARELDLESLKAAGAKGKQIASKIEAEIVDLAERGSMSLPEMWESRSAIDNLLKKYYKGSRASADWDESAQALFHIRNRMRDFVVGAADKIPGAEPLRGELRKYHELSLAKDIAEKEMAAEMANRAISLTDTIAGVGGAAIKPGLGAGLGLATGGDAESAFWGGLAGAGLNKGLRTFGPGTSAVTAKKAAGLLRQPTKLISGSEAATRGLLAKERMDKK